MRIPNFNKCGRHTERGVATIVSLTLVAILLSLIAGNVRALWLLKRELQLVDLRQTHRTRTKAIAPVMVEPSSLPTAPEKR